MLPATSDTEPGVVWAVLVSVPFGTLVVTLNNAGVASPDPFRLSLAVQGADTSVACQAATGGEQLNVGAVRSTLIVSVGLALLTVFAPLSLAITLSIVPELSVAKKVNTVVPSAAPGMTMDPLAPEIVPEAGLGRFAPVALYVMLPTVGRVDGGL